MTDDPFTISPDLAAQELEDEERARSELTLRDQHLSAFAECAEEETEDQNDKPTNQQNDNVIPS